MTNINYNKDITNIQKIEPMQNTETYNLIRNSVYNSELTNKELVQIIELAGNFLNLQTISKYAKENNLSYNGVKKNREIVNLFDCKLVIDND